MENQTWRVDMQVRGKVLKEERAENQIEMFRAALVEYLGTLEKKKILENVKLDFIGIILDESTNKELDDDTAVIYPKGNVDAANELLDVQRLTVETDQFKYNDYMRGMYNGMELLQSTMEDRQPIYLDEFGHFSKKEGGPKK